MTETSAFHDLLRRLRGGEEAAWTELVQQYEPLIRRAVRFRVDSRLRRVLDSADICQSVFRSFFVRVALGQYELESPEQLQQLLVTMARNKLANRVHHEQAGRRDHRRVTAGKAGELRAVAPGSSPSDQVAAKELLQETRRRLSPAARRVLELRDQGLDWAAIAAELGGSPEALRKAFDRAVHRIARQLGLDQ
jgi:RNA polymerase sigma-70 factor (ECF subfamily)